MRKRRWDRKEEEMRSRRKRGGGRRVRAGRSWRK